MLPEVRPSAGSFGRESADVMARCPPLAGVAGDQQASLFGHGCFAPGSVKNTYGTGCFMLMNTGEQAIASQNGLVTTIGIATGFWAARAEVASLLDNGDHFAPQMG